MSEEIRVITKAQYKEYMELKKQAKTTQTKRWKPKVDEGYHCVLGHGMIKTNIWAEDVTDCGYYKLGNCFKTEEEAQKELDRRLAEQELLDMCDWEKDKPCYEIYYNFKEKCFEGDVCYSYSCYSPYRFATKESCQKAIDTLGTDKLKLIFRID